MQRRTRQCGDDGDWLEESHGHRVRTRRQLRRRVVDTAGRTRRSTGRTWRTRRSGGVPRTGRLGASWVRDPVTMTEAVLVADSEVIGPLGNWSWPCWPTAMASSLAAQRSTMTLHSFSSPGDLTMGELLIDDHVVADVSLSSAQRLIASRAAGDQAPTRTRCPRCSRRTRSKTCQVVRFEGFGMWSPISLDLTSRVHSNTPAGVSHARRYIARWRRPGGAPRRTRDTDRNSFLRIGSLSEAAAPPSRAAVTRSASISG